MEDIKEYFQKRICILCLNSKCNNCIDKIKIKKQENSIVYKCNEFKKRELKMSRFKDYVKYAFYDEIGVSVAIIKAETPSEVIEELKKEYEEIKFKE